MKKTIMIGWLSALLLLAGGLAGCGETEKDLKPNIYKDSISVFVNESVLLEAENSEGAAWSSSDESVCIVENGTIKGVKAGKATITLTLGEKKDTISVTVSLPAIELDMEANTVVAGDTFVIEAVTAPAETSVIWSSSNEGVAEVLNGRVTTIAAGSTTITAKMTAFGTDYTATCELTVTNRLFTPALNEDVFNTRYKQGGAAIDLSYTNTDADIKNFAYTVDVKQVLIDVEKPVTIVGNKLSADKCGEYKVTYTFTGDNMITTSEECKIVIEEINDYGTICTFAGGDYGKIIKKNWFSRLSYDTEYNALKLTQEFTDWEPASISFDIYSLLNTNVKTIKLDMFFESERSDVTRATICYGVNKLDEKGELTKNYTFTKTDIAANKWVTVEVSVSKILEKLASGVKYDCVRFGLANCAEDIADDPQGVLYMKNLGFGFGEVSLKKGDYTTADLPGLYDLGDKTFTSKITAINDSFDSNILDGENFTLEPGKYTIVYAVGGDNIKSGTYEIALDVLDFRGKYDYGTINTFGDKLSITEGVKELNSALSVKEIGGRNALSVKQVGGNYGVTLDDFDILTHRNKIRSISYDIYTTVADSVENGWSDNKSFNVIAEKVALKANVWQTVTVNLDSLYGVKFGGWGDYCADESRLKDLQIRFQDPAAGNTEFYLSNFRVNFEVFGAVNGTDLRLPALGMKNFAYTIADVKNSENQSVSDKVQNQVLVTDMPGVYTVIYNITGDDVLTNEYVMTIKVGASSEGKFINFNDDFAADRVTMMTHDSGSLTYVKDGNTMPTMEVSTWKEPYPGNTAFNKLKISNQKAWDGSKGLGCAVGLRYGDLLNRDAAYEKITIKLYVSVNEYADMHADIGFFKDTKSDGYADAKNIQVATNQWTTIEVTKAALQSVTSNVYCYDYLRLHFIDNAGYSFEIYISEISFN